MNIDQREKLRFRLNAIWIASTRHKRASDNKQYLIMDLEKVERESQLATTELMNLKVDQAGFGCEYGGAVSMGAIQRLVCKYYKVTKEELRSPSRKRAIVQPRQIAMYLARQHTDQSLQAIGRSFNRYHATTLHAIGAVERHIRENSQALKQVEFLSQKLKEMAGGK